MNIYYFALNCAQITVYCKATIQQHVVYLTKPKLYANCVTHNVIFKINYFTAVVL